MRVYENGKYRDMTAEEIAEMDRVAAEVPPMTYDEAVVAKIRERYSLDQELAISRQRDTKPEEFAEFFAYCEECKSYYKAKEVTEQ